MMFERELRDGMTVKRWGIVRTIKDQSVAEHSHMVSLYTNDIASHFGYEPELHLLCLQYALWHDVKDEIISGDFPGPAKRALVKDRDLWDKRLNDAAHKIFGENRHREGHTGVALEANIVKLTVKVADWLDAAMFCMDERQFGNLNVQSHVEYNSQQCLESAELLISMLHNRVEHTRFGGMRKALQVALSSGWTESRGPWAAVN
jgi:5'-deoxynucleotidase YfbR-like HD superfamily hydrolase